MTTQAITQPEIRLLAKATAIVGEGPVISADGSLVHWVDIFAGQLHTTRIADGQTSSVSVDTLLGAVARREAGGFVAATREGFAVIGESGELDQRLNVLAPGTRMNDAKCDSAGRFWAGSTAMDFATGHAALHVLEPDWTSRIVLDSMTLPNGLGWSPDDSTFYLVDSLERTLSAWDFDLASAALSGKRVLFSFADETGLPDGLTVDAEGNIWLAMWGGSEIRCLSASGAVLRRVSVPVRQPSSCAFGGPNRDQLVVTSAAQDLQVAAQDWDGSLLLIPGLCAKGLPSASFAG